MTKRVFSQLGKPRILALLTLALLAVFLGFRPDTMVKAAQSRAALDNPAYTLTSTDGTAVSTKANPNETTVLIFGHTKCSYTRTTLNSLTTCDWIKRSDIRVIFVETNFHTQEEVMSYEQGYQCPDMTFCYAEDDRNITAMIGYAGLYGLTGSKYPMIVLIDKNNQVQNLLTGTKTADEVLNEIKKFEPIDGEGSNPPTTEPDSGIENLVYGLHTIDGTVVSTKATPNQTTVLLFGYTTCGLTKGTLQSICGSSLANRPDVRLIFADVYGASLNDTKEFAQNYAGKGILFCHDESALNYNIALTYLSLNHLTGGTFPYIVLIDKNNKIRSITLGPRTAEEISADIEKISANDQNTETPTEPSSESSSEPSSESSSETSSESSSEPSSESSSETSSGSTQAPSSESPKKDVANVTGLKAVSAAKTIKLSWKKTAGADGYFVYQYQNAKKTWVKKATLQSNTTSYKITGLTPAANYRFAVKAYVKLAGGGEVSSDVYTSLYTATAPNAVNFKVTPGKKKAVIKWKKVKGATGYNVYYKTKAKGAWKKLKSTKSTSYTKTKLKSGETYYFTVEAYKTYKKTNYASTRTAKKVKIK